MRKGQQPGWAGVLGCWDRQAGAQPGLSVLFAEDWAESPAQNVPVGHSTAKGGTGCVLCSVSHKHLVVTYHP